MTIPHRTRRAAAGGISRVRFLASVTSLEEAEIAVSGGADIVDAKNPAAGALGALPLATIRAIRDRFPGVALSATIGNPSSDAAATAAAVTATAAAGVDFVKIGLARSRATRDTIARVGALALPPCRLVGVLIADRGIDIEELPRLAAAGFAGVMLDTDDKTGRALPDILTPQALAAFVTAAHTVGLFAGLAGALRLPHVAGLKAAGPDILGFRGALCVGERREARMDAEAVARVRKAVSAGTGGRPAAGAVARADAGPAQPAATLGDIFRAALRSSGERVP